MDIDISELVEKKDTDEICKQNNEPHKQAAEMDEESQIREILAQMEIYSDKTLSKKSEIPCTTNASFEYMYKDEVVARVVYSNSHNLNVGGLPVHQEVYGKHLLDTPMPESQPNMRDLWRFFKSRIFPKHRGNIEELLNDLKIPEKTEAIIRKTHGVLWDDFYWVRFEGESCTWEDVRLRV